MSNFIVILILITTTAWAQKNREPAAAPTFGLSGSATLASNFVERGLTQTDADPGLQGDFWFNFGPQFRLGVWGANVNYENTATTHFWLRANADIRVDFSPEAAMFIKYSENSYYRANNRNGNTIGLHFDFWGYKISYEKDSNWEGTDKPAMHAGLGKDFSVFSSWLWMNTIGYTMPDADVDSYFHIRTGLGTQLKDIFLDLSVSYSTATDEFKDRGEMAFILRTAVTF